MGGTFDPIHYGHLLTAEEALQQFSLDAVIFVPTGQPWMKEHEAVSPPEDRYLMTVIATASNPRFRVSRIEVDRDGPTYTIDTLRWLKDEHGPDADLFFITGADAILEIVQWKDQEELFELAHFIAATRPGLRHRGVRRAPRDHRDAHPRARDQLDRHPRARSATAGRSATWSPRASTATCRRRSCTGERERRGACRAPPAVRSAGGSAVAVAAVGGGRV